MKKIFIICFSLISLQIIAQEAVIPEVPAYIWRHGCGPTSEGMVLGYYDLHGFPDLIPGDASSQTDAVNAVIASDEHYNDYSLPLDDANTGFFADKSETGGAHANNCIADYMGTSQSIKGNYWGWSLPSDMKPAWENYISEKASDYIGTSQKYDFDSFPWDSLVSNVDRNRPMVFLVDASGDGIYDHYVCVIGYGIQDGKKYYNCLDTWDGSYEHWYEFKKMAAGVVFGVLSCYTFEIHLKLPAAAGPISGPTSVCNGQTSVTYYVPVIAEATSYIWTLPAGCTGSSSTQTINVDFGTTAVSGNISVKGHNVNGDGVSSSLAVTVNTVPAAAGTITGLTTVCQGQTSVTYTVPAIGNATSYTWTLPTGASGTSTTNSITVNFGTSAVSGNVTVKGTNSCDDGTSSSLAVTVNPLPAAAGTITGLTTVCQGQTSVTYTVPAITNATSYIWTLPSGASGTSTTNSITVNFGTSAVSGNVTVKGTNSCDDGTSSSLAVTVNPLPAAAGTITGLTTVCQGQTSVTYTVPAIGNATSYTWTLPSGASGTSTTNSITVNFGTSAVSGNVTVKGTNSCGNGTSFSLAVTVNP
ncbi:MAG: hypothetical protein ABFD02_00770, partial [Bacteroidales bacterium]